ncbi:hypothetical protein ACLQ2R_33885 [Streptosporangium sp. DT93]|uniref:hypothetical protein n=1 Tax=Streptosporangium sp. DT93 TaxID=3393428 RepID=UPI003CEF376C
MITTASTGMTDNVVRFYRMLCRYRARPAAMRASSPVMPAIPTPRLRRPAALGAGRLVAHAVVVVAVIVGVVFAHGGACAAAQLSNPTTASPVPNRTTPLAQGAGGAVQPGSRCVHRQLPPGQQHDTEQDHYSAVASAGTPTFVAAAVVAVSAPGADEAAPAVAAAGRPGAPCRDNLCVMRI